jgi:LacI family transcriptional regulator
MTTIKDVAKAAQVSIATVSRALNGDAKVRPETAAKIKAIASEMRFVPSNAARSMITRRTEMIGVLLPDLHGEFFSELIRGIDQVARGTRYHLLVSSSHDNVQDAVAAIQAMAGRVDGMLLMSPTLDGTMLTNSLPSDLPAVLMNTRVPNRSYASFIVDNYSGAYSMMRHLVGLGHRSIAMIAGPEHNFEAQERLRAYRDALRELLPHAIEQIWQGDFTEQSGWRVGQQVLSMTARPDAIFAANDMMALGCLSTLREAGLNVPRDIALVGFDDIPTARFIAPRLTTVRVRIADLGSIAFQRLLSILERDPKQGLADEGKAVALPSELIVRSSCGSAPR